MLSSTCYGQGLTDCPAPLALCLPSECVAMQFGAAACALVYVPSRKQAQLTAIDLMAFAAASGEPHHVLGAGTNPDDLAPVTNLAGLGGR